MSDDFKFGVPESLDSALRIYTGSSSNITPFELKQSVTGYGPCTFYSGKNKFYCNEGIFFFFPKAKGSVIVNLDARLFIALQNQMYGFKPNKNVEIAPVRLELALSVEARRRYDSIFQCSKTLNELLEDVGFIINSSMAYDLDKFVETGNAFGWNVAKQAEKLRLEYKPSGKEVAKGVCYDAGKQIRDLLSSLGLAEEIKYARVVTYDGKFGHDTTLVFDKYTGEWAVISSKSPYKQFNLASLQQLDEIGTPFRSPKKKIRKAS